MSDRSEDGDERGSCPVRSVQNAIMAGEEKTGKEKGSVFASPPKLNMNQDIM